MLLDGGAGLVERDERVVSEQNAQARIVIGAALLVEGLKRVKPQAAAGAGSYADFQEVNFWRQATVFVQLAEKGPEIGYAVGDGGGVMRVGSAAGQSSFVAAAGPLLPFGEVVPVKLIEIPGDAAAEGFEIFERQAIRVLRVGAREGAQNLAVECAGLDLTRVDAEF